MKTPKKTLPLCRLLQQQGFGSRRDCCRLVWDGYVSIRGEIQTDPNAEIKLEKLVFHVANKEWTYRHRLYLKLHKPAGYECTRTSDFHESVLVLFPPQFVERGLQAAGRLDVDTEGLLLLSDDGQFLHHVTSPKREIPKRYLVHLKHAVEQDFVQTLLGGVELRAEKEIFQAKECQLIDPQTLEMTISEGKFHQVKRMVAAAGNRVESLERHAVRGVVLGDLEPGKWAELSAEEIASLGYQTKV